MEIKYADVSPIRVHGVGWFAPDVIKSDDEEVVEASLKKSIAQQMAATIVEHIELQKSLQKDGLVRVEADAYLVSADAAEVLRIFSLKNGRLGIAISE